PQSSPLGKGERPTSSSSFPFPAILPDQTHRFVNNFSGDVERRTKTDRPITRAQRQNAKIEQSFPKSLTRSGIRQLERQHPSAARPSRRRSGLFFRTRADRAACRNVGSTTFYR